MISKSILTTSTLALSLYASTNLAAQISKGETQTNAELYEGMPPLEYISSDGCPKAIAEQLHASNKDRQSHHAIFCQSMSFCEETQAEAYPQTLFSLPEVCEYDLLAAESEYHREKMRYFLQEIREAFHRKEYSLANQRAIQFEHDLDQLYQPERMIHTNTGKTINPNDDPRDVLYAIQQERRNFHNQHQDLMLSIVHAVNDIAQRKACYDSGEDLDILLAFGERISRRSCLPEAFITLTDRVEQCLEEEPETGKISEEQRKFLLGLVVQITILHETNMVSKKQWCDMDTEEWGKQSEY